MKRFTMAELANGILNKERRRGFFGEIKGGRMVLMHLRLSKKWSLSRDLGKPKWSFSELNDEVSESLLFALVYKTG